MRTVIETIVRDHLAGALNVPVLLEVPEGPVPTAFVTLEKTGSSETDRLSSATLAAQSWGPTLYDAASLNEAVKAAMDGLPTAPEVFSCRLQSDYNWPDLRSKRRRYQAVFEIFYKEERL